MGNLGLKKCPWWKEEGCKRNLNRKCDGWRELECRYSYHGIRGCIFDIEPNTPTHSCEGESILLFYRGGCSECKKLFEAQYEHLLAPLGVSIEIFGTEDCFRLWKALVFATLRHEIGKLTDEELADFRHIVAEIAKIIVENNERAREKREEEQEMKEKLRQTLYNL